MSRSKPPTTRSTPERYHHGDLRSALLEAGQTLLSEVGPDGFTLREVARRAGVSHAAPYHHFPDKAALLEALAIQTFEALTQAMQAETAPQPLERLSALGVAYVRFALAHPASFRLVFGPAGHARTPELEQVGQQAYALLRGTLEAAQAAGLLRERPLEVQTLTAWSLMHGLAHLLLEGHARTTALTPEALAQALSLCLRQGLEAEPAARHP